MSQYRSDRRLAAAIHCLISQTCADLGALDCNPDKSPTGDMRACPARRFKKRSYGVRKSSKIAG
jgi:hypothetical protein